MKLVAHNMPLLVGTVLVMGLLSVGKAKKLDDIAVEVFEEERYQDIVKQAPDEIGIDPKDAYEGEMRMESLENFSNVGDGHVIVAGDVLGRRLRALMKISDTSAPDAVAGGTARNLGGRKSESKRKKSLFKKKSSSKSKKQKKDSDDTDSSKSKSKKKSQKKSSSSSTDDKSKKRKKKSDSSTDDESRSKSKKDKKSDSDSGSSKSKRKSTKKSDSDSSTESKSKKKDKKSTKDSKDSKVSSSLAHIGCFTSMCNRQVCFVDMKCHMIHSDISHICKNISLFRLTS